MTHLREPRDKDHPCTAPDCRQPSGWTYEAKKWRPAQPGDTDRKCWTHGPGAARPEPKGRTPKLPTRPTYDDAHRLNNVAMRAARAADTLPSVRASIDDRIRDTVEGQGKGKGSGISDPTGGQALAIRTDEEHHRALSRAVKGVEDAVEHLRITAERALSPRRDAGTDTVLRCPNMVLLTQHVPLRDGELVDQVLVRCDRLTAHRVDQHGNAIDYDPDGLCDDCRAEADEAKRRIEIETNRRQRRLDGRAS